MLRDEKLEHLIMSKSWREVIKNHTSLTHPGKTDVLFFTYVRTHAHTQFRLISALPLHASC